MAPLHEHIRGPIRLYSPPRGEVAEWSNAAVLKTVDQQWSGGSNPSLSAILRMPTRSGLSCSAASLQGEYQDTQLALSAIIVLFPALRDSTFWVFRCYLFFCKYIDITRPESALAMLYLGSIEGG